MKRLEVCAAVIRQNGWTLICSRPKNSALGGFYEFPGGKCEPGETSAQCVLRELNEELGVRCLAFDQIHCLDHDYPDKSVRVHFIRCVLLPDSPPPEPRDGQDIKWVRTTDLAAENFLPADLPLAALLADAAKKYGSPNNKTAR